MTDATQCILIADLIPQPDGTVTVRSPNGGVFSVQPNGKVETRPAGTAGAWEKARRNGGRLIYQDHAYPTGAYALLVEV